MSVDVAEEPAHEPVEGPREEGPPPGKEEVEPRKEEVGPRRGRKVRARLAQAFSVVGLILLLLLLWRFLGGRPDKAANRNREQAVPPTMGVT